jgi:hypothetical protein
MPTQLITPSRLGPSAPGRARHRRIHTAAAIAGVAALIATGGYLAMTTIGPDTAPPSPRTGTVVNPTSQAQREMHRSITGQYASRPAAGTLVNPNVQAQREMHRSITGQYASRPAAATVVNPNVQALREMHRSITGQYGPAR